MWSKFTRHILHCAVGIVRSFTADNLVFAFQILTKTYITVMSMVYDHYFFGSQITDRQTGTQCLSLFLPLSIDKEHFVIVYMLQIIHSSYLF